MANLEESLGEGFEKITDKFKSAEELAKAYQNLEKLSGRSVKKPETDSEMDKFYEQIGVPDSVEGYEGGSEGQKKTAKDLRLTPDQYRRLQTAERRSSTAWEEFVESTPNFEERAAAAKTAADRLGVEFKNDPSLFTVLSELGRTMTNDIAPDGSGSSDLGGPKKAKQRLMEILSSEAWNNRRANPAERVAIQEEADTL